MIGELIDTALEFLKNNQFASGGLVMGVGAVIYRHGGSVAGTIKRFVWRRIFVTVKVDKWTYGFEWMREWLGDVLEQNKKLVHEYEIDAYTRNSKSNIELTQSDGRWLFAPGGFRIFVVMHRVEEKTDWGTRVYNKMYVTTGRWNKKKLKKMMSEVGNQYGRKPAGKIYVPTSDGMDWEAWCDVPNTQMEHVILPRSLKQTIIDDIHDFLQSEEKYRELGLAYKRGYLLFGPPGNGKTSFIRALAHHLGKSIAFVKATQLGGCKVQHLISKTGSDKLIVIEDIDRANVVNKPAEEEEKIEKPKPETEIRVQSTEGELMAEYRQEVLQTILNLLDGVQGGNGQIIITTANNPEKLDSAFLRPGRIDRKFELANADSEQIKQLFIKFFGEDLEDAATAFSNMVQSDRFSMARIQQHFIENLDDPGGVVDNINELFKNDTYSIPTQPSEDADTVQRPAL